MTATMPDIDVDDIPGWFSFREYYEDLAESAPPGSTLVELGVFCGKSLAWLAKAVRHKHCRVIGVDTFLGSPEFDKTVSLRTPVGDQLGDWSEMPPGILATKAVQYLDRAGVLNDVTLIMSDSARAAELFADGSVHAVFVDAGHDADSVERDVRAWFPKVAPGGCLAGDDYDHSFPGVREGLLRVLRDDQLPPLPPEGSSTTWLIRIPE